MLAVSAQLRVLLLVHAQRMARGLARHIVSQFTQIDLPVMVAVRLACQSLEQVMAEYAVLQLPADD